MKSEGNQGWGSDNFDSNPSMGLAHLGLFLYQFQVAIRQNANAINGITILAAIASPHTAFWLERVMLPQFITYVAPIPLPLSADPS